jgi:hypothetical protein
MADEPVFFLTASQWQLVIFAIRADSQALGDGAEVEIVDLRDTQPPGAAVTFYATRENHPAEWPYPILERDAHGHVRTYIGDAQRDTDGRIILQVWLKEAVEQLLADYQGGATDLDEAALDTRVGEVAAGRDQDRQWLVAEFRKLLATCEIVPSPSPA